MKSPFLTPTELAEFLGMSRNKVYHLIERNEIPCKRIGNRILIRREVVEEWLGLEKSPVSPPPVVETTPPVIQCGLDKETLIEVLEAVLAVLKKR